MERLTPEEKFKIQEMPTENLEAYNLYLQGRFFWNKRTEVGLRKAKEYFEQAIKIDQNYALAYTGLADCYNMLGAYSYLPSKEAFLQAKAAAEKALEIDESLAEAHVSITQVKEYYDWDWSGAEKEYKRAIELNPNYATAHQWYAEYLSLVGRSNEAIAEIKRAQELDPLSLIINVEAGRIYTYARQYDRAIEQFQKSLNMDPNYLPAHVFLALAYAYRGMSENAIEQIGKALELTREDDIFVLQYRGLIYSILGLIEKTNKILELLFRLSRQKYVSPFLIANMHACLDQKDQVFEWLEKAYVNRDSNMNHLKVSPALDNIRSDPRFIELLKKVGLD